MKARAPPGREPLPLTPPEKPPKDKPPVLEQLKKPIGQPEVPAPGDNSAVDVRPLRERIDDYFDSREATRTWLKPYFRDWTMTRHHRGKTFLATPKLFRAEAAMYFPNMQGYTLEDPKTVYDTTNVLRGKFSIVSVVSEQWAERQAKSFTDPKQNPALASEVERLKVKGLQKVFINIEEDCLKAFIVRLSLGHWRKITPREDWHRTFLVKRGVTDYTRLDIKMTNAKVGHVYLVDGHCKIRWAGCGDATDEEKESLVHCVRRLVEPPAKVTLDRRSPMKDRKAPTNARLGAHKRETHA
ncbi:MAG: hypothetical protein Q9217_003350 [Psora testacea]